MKKIIFALAAGLAFLGGTAARAQPQLDFGTTGGETGSVSYAGGTAALIGSVNISTVQGEFGTPLNNNVSLAITGGNMSFNTGAGSGTAGAWSWTGTAGNSISITGGVAGTTPPLGAGSTLLSGTIVAASVVEVNGAIHADLSAFVDTVNPTLASYYGLTGGPTVGWSGSVTLDLQLSGSPATGSAFSTTSIGSGDTYTSPVPEPSSMAIAGLGALGMIGYGLRRRKALGA